MQLKIAEQYITQFGNLAKAGTSLVVPANVADVSSMLALAMNSIKTPHAEPKIPVRIDQPRV
jgi:hypothetical protein